MPEYNEYSCEVMTIYGIQHLEPILKRSHLRYAKTKAVFFKKIVTNFLAPFLNRSSRVTDV